MKKLIFCLIFISYGLFGASFTYNFKSGWNHFTVPFELKDNTPKYFVENLLQSRENIESIWGIDIHGKWVEYYNTHNAQAIMPYILEVNKPYYIKCFNPISKEIEGKPADRTIYFKGGWNLLTSYDIEYSIDKYIEILNSNEGFSVESLSLKDESGLWLTHNPAYDLNTLSGSAVLNPGSFFYVKINSLSPDSYSVVKLPLNHIEEPVNFIYNSSYQVNGEDINEVKVLVDSVKFEGEFDPSNDISSLPVQIIGYATESQRDMGENQIIVIDIPGIYASEDNVELSINGKIYTFDFSEVKAGDVIKFALEEDTTNDNESNDLLNYRYALSDITLDMVADRNFTTQGGVVSFDQNAYASMEVDFDCDSNNTFDISLVDGAIHIEQNGVLLQKYKSLYSDDRGIIVAADNYTNINNIYFPAVDHILYEGQEESGLDFSSILPYSYFDSYSKDRFTKFEDGQINKYILNSDYTQEYLYTEGNYTLNNGELTTTYTHSYDSGYYEINTSRQIVARFGNFDILQTKEDYMQVDSIARYGDENSIDLSENNITSWDQLLELSDNRFENMNFESDGTIYYIDCDECVFDKFEILEGGKVLRIYNEKCKNNYDINRTIENKQIILYNNKIYNSVVSTEQLTDI